MLRISARSTHVRASLPGPDERPDPVLIAAARDGDEEAFGVLYLRHHLPALAVARKLTAGAAAEDIVAESFTNVLTALRAGKGPELAFRPYLLTVIRRVAAQTYRHDRLERPLDPEIHGAHSPDHGSDIAAAGSLEKAFQALPERSRAVLWYVVVEGNSHARAGALLGMRNRTVTAAVNRARHQLATAYLATHMPPDREPGCAKFDSSLIRWTLNELTGHAQQTLTDHVATCHHCQELRDTLREVRSGLRANLIPALTGVAASVYLPSLTAGTGIVVATTAGGLSLPPAIASLATVLAVTILPILSLTATTDHSDHAQPPPSAATALRTMTTTPSPTSASDPAAPPEQRAPHTPANPSATTAVPKMDSAPPITTPMDAPTPASSASTAPAPSATSTTATSDGDTNITPPTTSPRGSVRQTPSSADSRAPSTARKSMPGAPATNSADPSRPIRTDPGSAGSGNPPSADATITPAASAATDEPRTLTAGSTQEAATPSSNDSSASYTSTENASVAATSDPTAESQATTTSARSQPRSAGSSTAPDSGAPSSSEPPPRTFTNRTLMTSPWYISESWSGHGISVENPDDHPIALTITVPAGVALDVRGETECSEVACSLSLAPGINQLTLDLALKHPLAGTSPAIVGTVTFTTHTQQWGQQVVADP